MSIRVLIVDDEPLARRSLLRHLRLHPGVEVIGECGDGRSAVAAILGERPDLVFLDIQMAEMDGFQVIARIGPQRMPAVIFVTAYDEYALRAFEANALDYLLKPFRKERLDRALDRAIERIGRSDTEYIAKIAAAVDAVSARDYLERIPVALNGRIAFVKVDEIEWIEGAGNYAQLHLARRTHEIRETLSNLERKLDPKKFARVHRSSIVNVSRIKEIQPWFHGYHLILLESGQQVRMSRYQRDAVRRLACTHT